MTWFQHKILIEKTKLDKLNLVLEMPSDTDFMPLIPGIKTSFDLHTLFNVKLAPLDVSRQEFCLVGKAQVVKRGLE